MASIIARLLRESTPDSYDYVIPGDSSKTRRRITRARKLPVNNTSTPVTRGTVKVTHDVEITDASGALLRVQPVLIDIEVSIPVGVDETVFVAALNNAFGVARVQIKDIYAGLLPGDTLTFAPETGT